MLASSTDKARILLISPGALSLPLSMLLGIPSGVRLISLPPLINGTFLWGIFSFSGHVELSVLFFYTNKRYHQVPKADALFCGFGFDPRSQSSLLKSQGDSIYKERRGKAFSGSEQGKSGARER